MARRNPVQAVPGPLRDVGQPLSAGNLNLRGLASPSLQKLAITLLDLIEGQSFQLAMIELADIFFDENGKIVRIADQTRRVMGTLQIAGINSMNRLTRQSGRNFLGLADSDLVELAVTRSLAASLQVPVSCAVPHQENIHKRFSGKSS